jgi:hypothetical protein
MPFKAGPPAPELARQPLRPGWKPNFWNEKHLNKAKQLARGLNYDVDRKKNHFVPFTTGTRPPKGPDGQPSMPYGYKGDAPNQYQFNNQGHLTKLTVEDGRGTRTLVLCSSKARCNVMHPMDDICPMELAEQIRASKMQPNELPVAPSVPTYVVNCYSQEMAYNGFEKSKAKPRKNRSRSASRSRQEKDGYMIQPPQENYLAAALKELVPPNDTPVYEEGPQQIINLNE